MGQFLNQIRKKLGLEPRRDKTLTGKIPNEVVVSRATQNESAEVHHHITQGRMNPLTVGHESVVNQVKKAAKTQGGGHTIILTGSHDAKKNPLSPEQKLKHAKRAFPNTNIKVADKSKPTILHHLSDLHDQGVTHLHLHVGSDRADSFHKLIHDYNGKESKHGYYNFKHITIHKVGGERSETSSGVSGASGTKMRQHATSGNLPEFKKMAPSKMSDAHKEEMYHDVRNGMSVKEASEEYGYPVPAIPTRTARDFIGKKSPLNKLPAPGDKGNVGLDVKVKDGKEQSNFELMRRRSKKRQVHVGFLEGYDDIEGIGATDTPKYPESNAPTTQAMKTSRINAKRIKSEGLFAADIANGETGESGSPNHSMEGVPTTAKEKTKVKDYKAVREACWANYKQVGTKKKNGKTVPNCVPKEEVELDEKRGLWDNIHAKRKRIKAGSGERMRKPGSEGAPTAAALKASQTEEFDIDEATYQGKKVPLNKPMKGDVKKSKVYVDPDGDGKAQKVNFGDKTLSIKKNIPARKKSYCARSGGQGNLNDKTSANYWSRRAWNCEEVDYDDDDEGYTQKAGKFHRGDRVKVKKDGYTIKGNIDMYDPTSDTYLVSTDKQGSNLHLKADEIEPLKESLSQRVKAILEGKK